MYEYFPRCILTVFGGTDERWNNGNEKMLAAICRKIAMIEDGSEIEMWGIVKQEVRKFRR